MSKVQSSCVAFPSHRGTQVHVVLVLVTILSLMSIEAVAGETFVSFSDGHDVREVDVPISQSITIKTDNKFADLVVGDSHVADVFPLTEESFYVLGKKQGRTNVALYDSNRRLIGITDIEVTIDADDLRLAIRQAAPRAHIDVQAVNGRIRLSGKVPDGVTLRKILEIAEQYGSDQVINALRVSNAQQVLLEVRLLEAKRSAGRELGVSWWIRDSANRGFTSGAVNRPDVSTPVFTIDSRLTSGSEPFGTLVAQVLDAGVNADIVVQALEQKGLARRLAEPNLVALSGEEASFHAGGQVPIPVPGGKDNDITIEYKPFGVRLNFTPVVLDDGLINLKLEPEVSEPDPSISIRTNDIEVPGFVTRTASTTLELRDGQSFAMAGLLQTTHTKSQSQLPWLGQVPILGALFRSSDFQKRETDLVIIVTPHIVRPAKPGEPLRTPLSSSRPSNDAEFFLLGMQEVTDEMLRKFEEGTGIIGPYGHIIELKAGASHVYSKN